MTTGHAAHLVRRFFGFLGSRPPSPAEQRFVARVLRPEEAALFFAQRPEDQRHALEVAARVARRLPGDATALTAALLHDVGKIDAPIGAVSRSIATVLDAAHLPTPARMAAYRRHGSLGARRLAAVGADTLVVAFAARHPERTPPPGIAPDRWDALVDADEGS